MSALLASLAATIAALAIVVWSGITRRRTVHYAAVVGMLGLLGVAIHFAERFGSQLEFTGAAGTVHSVHMVAVVLTFLALPLVAWTGLRLARAGRTGADRRAPAGPDDPGQRAGHRRSAALFVTLVVITSSLGTVMTVLALEAAG